MVFALSHVCVYSHYGDIHSFSIEKLFHRNTLLCTFASLSMSHYALAFISNAAKQNKKTKIGENFEAKERNAMRKKGATKIPIPNVNQLVFHFSKYSILFICSI